MKQKEFEQKFQELVNSVTEKEEQDEGWSRIDSMMKILETEWTVKYEDGSWIIRE